MYGGGGGAHGRAVAFGGGSTKPPMVDNYLDSHGLNAGLGNAGASKFPSVVESRPIQVRNKMRVSDRTSYGICALHHS